MINRQLVLTSTFLLAICSALHAGAEILLFEQTISINRSPNIFDNDHFDVDVVFGDSPFVPTNAVVLFDGLVVSPDDVGSIYEATAGTDVSFSTVAGRVTDGLDEFIIVSMTEDEVGGLKDERISQEKMFFEQTLPASPPDLAGNDIEKVTLEVDSFTLAGPGESVEGQPVDLVVTISFFGIPEPQTLAMLGIGLASFMTLRKRRVERD